jgi:hypothetical protein
VKLQEHAVAKVCWYPRRHGWVRDFPSGKGLACRGVSRCATLWTFSLHLATSRLSLPLSGSQRLRVRLGGLLWRGVLRHTMQGRDWGGTGGSQWERFSARGTVGSGSERASFELMQGFSLLTFHPSGKRGRDDPLQNSGSESPRFPCPHPSYRPTS